MAHKPIKRRSEPHNKATTHVLTTSTRSVVMENLSGLMAANSKAIGSTVKRVALVFSEHQLPQTSCMKGSGSRTGKLAYASSAKMLALTFRMT